VSFDEYGDPLEEPTGYGGQHAAHDIETDLRHLIDLVAAAKQMPLSNSALVPRDEVLALLEQALRDLPDEIREARWALRDREELMAAELQKAQQLMDQVRAEAARMVDRTEIVRQSRLAAERIVAEAQAKARTMINQAEDFIDGKLGNFEIVLERLLRTTRSGRERLSAQGLSTTFDTVAEEAGEIPPPAPAPYPTTGPEEGADASFFDQDAF
jgi:cell division septum initiation protein DivIVA